MFAVYLATRLLYRDRAMLNALGAAALALLIVDPEALFGASFQMTFLCVGLVAGVGLPLLQRTIEPYSRGLRNLDALAYDRSLPARVTQFRLDLRLLLNRIGGLLPGRIPRIAALAGLRILFGLSELAVISAVLQIGLALPMAYYFHRATSVAMPANLLVVPFLQLLMPAAVLAIGVSYVSLWLAKIPAAIAGFALEGIAGTVKWLGGWRTFAWPRRISPQLCLRDSRSSSVRRWCGGGCGWHLPASRRFPRAHSGFGLCHLRSRFVRAFWR
jgi:competence protein ComEC